MPSTEQLRGLFAAPSTWSVGSPLHLRIYYIPSWSTWEVVLAFLQDKAIVSLLLGVLSPLGSERALAINADYMNKASVSGANSLPLRGLAI